MGWLQIRLCRAAVAAAFAAIATATGCTRCTAAGAAAHSGMLPACPPARIRCLLPCFTPSSPQVVDKHGDPQLTQYIEDMLQDQVGGTHPPADSPASAAGRSSQLGGRWGVPRCLPRL